MPADWCTSPVALLERDTGRLTPCQEELLRCIPAAILFIFGVPRLHSLLRGPSPSVPRTLLYWAKVALAVTILATHVGSYLISFAEGTICEGKELGCQELALALGTAALLFAIVLTHFDHLRSRTPSTPLLFFWLFAVVTSLVKLRSYFVLKEYDHDRAEFAVYVAYIVLSTGAFALENVHKPGTYYLSLDEDVSGSPEVNASIYSRLSFQWMDPLMKLGYRKDLEMEDLWSLNREDKAEVTGAVFQAQWEQELTKKRPSLLRALTSTYGLYFGRAAIFKAAQDALAFVQPLFLRQMMDFARGWSDHGDHPLPIERGFLIAGLMLLTAVTQTIMLHQYFHICLVTGMRIRSAIVTSVYRKSLVLSNSSRQSSTTGEIVNLQTVDASRLGDLCSYFHILWSGPLQITLAITFLYQTLGPSIFAGVGVMIAMIPCNAFLATRSRTLHKAQMKNKDNRTKMMDELLNGIKVIKLYAWERPFLKRIFGAREAELETLKKLGVLSAFQSFTWACTPFLVSFASFAVYTLVSDEPLTSSKVFVCISLFNLLQFPLSVFPSVISAIVEASVSFSRLHKFFMNEELDRNAVTYESVVFQPKSKPIERVSVKNGVFQWSKEGMPTLSDIEFSVRDKTLFAIVGSVGSGKSSTISALLGEMYKIIGEVTIRGSVSYVPQNAWITNSTLRENITFGKPYDPEFYQQVIVACGLKSDLEILPGGDSVEIGERGINLSGGQKQRVSLARAVYSRSDIYLFDDPLSAVDAHVGRWIFDHVVGPNGMLNDRTRILVTHGIHFLGEVDEVMMLQDGRISEIGSYQSLMQRAGPLQALIKEYGRKEVQDLEDPAEGDEGSSETAPDGVTSRRGSHSARRGSSHAALDGEDKKKNNVGTSLIVKEDSAVGSVSWDVYTTYAKACSMKIVALYIVIAIMSQCLSVAQNVYLADWAAENDRREAMTSLGGSRHNDEQKRVLKRLAIYGALGMIYSFTIIGQVIFAWVMCGIRSARKLHQEMLDNVIRLPQSFFDTTPAGRVQNRFSKDQYTVDETLPRVFQGYFRTMFAVLSVLAVNLLGSPLFFLFAIPLGYLYYYFQKFYLSASRQLKRLDSTSRSPIYAHFGETLAGVSSIRAYHQNARFLAENQLKVDYNMKAYYPSISSNRWLAVRLEFLGSLVVFGSAMFSVVTIAIKGSISPSIVGLMLTYSLNVTQTLNWMVRQSCEIETNIVSVERMKEYIELPQEAPYEVPETTPDESWPDTGRIEFRGYSTRYRAGLDLVLKDINFSIGRREKIGVVGRTGAGKSSLSLTLFRLIEPVDGQILIDDIDVSTLGLYDLRSHLTVIPQDPVLFSGTIRENLDPFGVHDDAAIWRALESSSLKTHVAKLDKGLSGEVLQGGENFSAGQRQLICLARALLRKTHILVLDEATAAIDVETDTFIQKTIREEFQNCTILTIAHRIGTVMDSDRIMVLERGRVAEFDTPANLLRNKKSMFYSLAKEAGQIA
ncbi:Canalicular multispecific organic anion transporter 2 [Geranomyces variabilis]|nr:Canalicular multispecific organic anion transporter 2 [Geranomyces variabilis]